MGYLEHLLATPHSYAAVAALALGAGVAGLIPGRRFRLRDSWKRAGRLARLYFCLSIALAVLTAAMFLLDPLDLLDEGLLYTAAVAFLLGVAIFRFPRTLGTLALLVALLLGGAIAALSTALYPPQPDQPEGGFRVLRAGGGTMVVEHIPAVTAFGDRGRIFTLQGDSIAVEVEVITLSEYLFFVGVEELYRMQSIHARNVDDGAAGTGAAEGQSQPFPRPQLVVARWLIQMMREHEERLPGLSVRNVRTAWVEPRPLERYVVEVTGTSVQLIWDKVLREAVRADDTLSSNDDHALPGGRP